MKNIAYYIIIDIYRNKLINLLVKIATKLAFSTNKTSFIVLGNKIRKVNTKK